MSVLNSLGTLNRRRLLQYGGAATLGSALLPQGSFAQSGAPVTLEVWSFAAAFPKLVEEYKRIRPEVTINLTAVPSPEQNIKMRAAIRAGGAGLPDVAQIQGRDLLSFTLTGMIADLGPLGASDFGPDFTPWLWQQVTDGDVVNGLPLDFGPMVLFCRQDIFDRIGIAVPATWDEFRTAAETVRAKDSSVYMTNVNLNQGWLRGLFWQAGEQPFAGDGTNIKIDVANAAAMKVAEYWQGLVNDDLVGMMPGYTTEWFSAMDAGQFACWPGASWSTNRLNAAAATSAGNWRMTSLPQWQAGESVTGNLGGSTLIMLENSPRKEAAAEFMFWAMHGDGAWQLADQGILTPFLGVQNSEEFLSKTLPIFGDQRFLEVVTAAAGTIDPNFQYSPFEDYAEQLMIDEWSQVSVGNGTIMDALNRTQEQLVTFATQQGFTVG